MRLDQWIAGEGRGVITRLMRATGLSYQAVHAIVHGRRPAYDSAERIAKATDNAVTVAEIYAYAAARKAAEKPVRINRKRKASKPSKVRRRKARAA